MKATPTVIWDAISKLKQHEDFTAKQLARKFSLEPIKSLPPTLSHFYRCGVLDQVGRQGARMIWRRTDRIWRQGMKRIRPSVTSAEIGRAITRSPAPRSKRNKSIDAVNCNGAIHVRIELHTERFAVLDDVRNWLSTCEGVEYKMQIVK